MGSTSIYIGKAVRTRRSQIPDGSYPITRLPRGTPTEGKMGFRRAPPPQTPQRLSLMALTGNAFTTLRAGLAFTTQILPKISRLPALVAGFVLVLSLQRPGNIKTPVLTTSLVANSAKLPMRPEHTDFFNSHEVAKASAMAPFDMVFPDFVAAFIVFMGAMATKGAKSANRERAKTG